VEENNLERTLTMIWYHHDVDSNLPEWLRAPLQSECEFCGHPIENGYNDKTVCTRRRCTNPNCIGVEAAKASYIITELGIKGIKEKTAYKIMRENGVSKCYDIIPIVLKEKPRVSLPQLFKFGFIFGLDSECSIICKDCNSVQEVYDTYKGNKLPKLLEVKEDLLYAEQFFTLKSKLKANKRFSPILFGCVVITGEIPAMEGERDKFVGCINYMYMGLTNFSYSRSKRKTGLYCCISEDKNAYTGKAAYAREAGVPVYTSGEFIESINKQIIEKGLWEEFQEAYQEEMARKLPV